MEHHDHATTIECTNELLTVLSEIGNQCPPAFHVQVINIIHDRLRDCLKGIADDIDKIDGVTVRVQTPGMN